MTPPKHELVVEDCDAALKLDHNYVKALNRRAGALESMKRYEEALRGKWDHFFRVCNDSWTHPVDFTAATILDKFQNEQAAQAVERVLKKLSTEKAAEILSVCWRVPLYPLYMSDNSTQTREPRLPSFTFISAYFAAFRSRQYLFCTEPKIAEPDFCCSNRATPRLTRNTIHRWQHTHSCSRSACSGRLCPLADPCERSARTRCLLGCR